MTKYLIAGGAAYIASRFVFDHSNTKSLLAAALAAGALWASLDLTEGIA